MLYNFLVRIYLNPTVVDKVAVWDPCWLSMDDLVTFEGKDYPFRPAKQWPESSYKSLQPVAVLDGHEGCVNSLSWNPNGQLLASGSDDLHISLWSYPLSGPDHTTQKPVSRTRTHHTDNIFASTWTIDGDRIVSLGRDGLVGLWKAEPSGRLTSERSFECNKDAAMRLAVDPVDPNLFLTCSMDGSVRQFDIRAPHRCNQDSDSGCSNVIISGASEQIGWHALSISPLRSELLALGGVEPTPLIFDRRFLPIGALLESTAAELAFEKPMQTWVPDMAACVRREISSVCFSPTSMLLAVSYNRGPIYTNAIGSNCTPSVDPFSEERSLYQDTMNSLLVEVYATKALARYVLNSAQRHESYARIPALRRLAALEFGNAAYLQWCHDYTSQCAELIARARHALNHSPYPEYDDAFGGNETRDNGRGEGSRSFKRLDIRETELFKQLQAQSIPNLYIGYQKRLDSHLNVQTIKDVSFVGTHGEFIATGCDGGYFFLYPAQGLSADPIFIGYGDGQVTNTVVSHPNLPVIATSGIAKTVKIWEPRDLNSVPGFTELEANERPRAVLPSDYQQVKEWLQRAPRHPSIVCQMQ